MSSARTAGKRISCLPATHGVSRATDQRMSAFLIQIVFLAAGADGAGAIYTEHVHFLHLVRMVILRVGAITDYLVLKLH